MRDGDQRHASGRFSLGKNPVPIENGDLDVPGSVWSGAENFAPPRLDPRTVHPVAYGYTDAIPGPYTVG